MQVRPPRPLLALNGTRLEKLVPERLGSKPAPAHATPSARDERGAAPARTVPAPGKPGPLGALGRCRDLGRKTRGSLSSLFFLALSFYFFPPFFPFLFFLNLFACMRRPGSLHLSQKK